MKICIIGSSGHWQYTLDEMKNHELVGVCPGFDGEDMNGVVSEFAKRGINTRICGGFDELLPANPDIAVINTRFDLNSVYTAECLRRNIYVFSEKPLAVTHEGLDSIINAASDSKAFVAAMFGITYEPWCIAVRNTVPRIGEIRMMNGRKSYKLGHRAEFYKNRSTFGGIIPWVSIHALHWMYATSGLTFKEVMAYTDNTSNNGHGDLETASACIFRMENGAIASVTADYFRPDGAPTHDDDRLRLAGDNGVIEYQNGRVLLITADGTEEIEQPDGKEVFRLFIDRIADGVSGVSMEESISITRAVLAARDSADSGMAVKIDGM